MSNSYSFEYDGVLVEYSRATVGTRMEGGRIIQKLLGAYGHVAGNPASNSEYDNFFEYAHTMARTRTDAAWWCHSDMSEEQIRERFEAFIDEDELLHQEFILAARATNAQKKMRTPTPTT